MLVAHWEGMESLVRIGLHLLVVAADLLLMRSGVRRTGSLLYLYYWVIVLTLATRLLIINCMCESVVSVALYYARELSSLLIKWVVTLAHCVCWLSFVLTSGYTVMWARLWVGP